MVLTSSGHRSHGPCGRTGALRSHGARLLSRRTAGRSAEQLGPHELAWRKRGRAPSVGQRRQELQPTAGRIFVARLANSGHRGAVVADIDGRPGTRQACRRSSLYPPHRNAPSMRRCTAEPTIYGSTLTGPLSVGAGAKRVVHDLSRRVRSDPGAKSAGWDVAD